MRRWLPQGCGPLVVAKVDRLTRSVAFLSRLLEAGVDVRFADLPRAGAELTTREIERLMAAARKSSRYGHRDATMILRARIELITAVCWRINRCRVR